jgi:hypothetical protein
MSGKASVVWMQSKLIVSSLSWTHTLDAQDHCFVPQFLPILLISGRVRCRRRSCRYELTYRAKSGLLNCGEIKDWFNSTLNQPETAPDEGAVSFVLRYCGDLVDTGFQCLVQFPLQNLAFRILNNRPFIQELLF